MKILSADTSLSSASVAVISDGKLEGEIMINQNKTHSEKFMLALEDLLKTLKIDISEIDLYTCGIGPGSFTGLRIGVTSMKSLSYIQKKPIVGINTLDALACGVGIKDSLVCPIIDARNMQVYTALFRIKDINEYPEICENYEGTLLKDFIIKVKENYTENIIFTGDCTNKFKEDIKKHLGVNSVFIPNIYEYPKASTIAYLGNIKYSAGIFDNPKTLEPFYLRPSQAERILKSKTKKEI